jgi:hypothetical protein
MHFQQDLHLLISTSEEKLEALEAKRTRPLWELLSKLEAKRTDFIVLQKEDRISKLLYNISKTNLQL